MAHGRRLAFSCFIFLLLGLASLNTFAQDSVKIGLLRLASHSPSIIADGMGYFAKQGLKVEFVIFQAAQPMAVAIASGDVDFGVTAISASLLNLAKKDVIRIVGGALTESKNIEGQKILVSKNAFEAGVTSPSQLRGKTFGVTTAGSSFHYMAHKIADKENFSRSDIRIKPLQKVPAVIAALKSGQIDAWAIVPNIADSLIKSGNVVEIGRVSDYITDYQVTVIFTSKAIVSEKPDLVKRFLKAFDEGVLTYNAAFVTKSLSAQKTDAVVAMVHKYIYSDQPIDKAGPRIKAGAMLISPQARLNLSSVMDQLDWFKEEGMVSKDLTIERIVDTRFVQTP